MSRATKIELRVSEDEKARWHLQAQAADLSLSGLIRRLMGGYLDDPYLAVAEAVSPVAGLPSARPSGTTSVDDSAHGEQAPAAPVPATAHALESPGSQLGSDETTAMETAAKEPWVRPSWAKAKPKHVERSPKSDLPEPVSDSPDPDISDNPDPSVAQIARETGKTIPDVVRGLEMAGLTAEESLREMAKHRSEETEPEREPERAGSGGSGISITDAQAALAERVRAASQASSLVEAR